MLRQRPAVRCALLLAGGILLSEVCIVPSLWIFLCLSGIYAATLIFLAVDSFPTRGMILVHVAVILLGMALATAEREQIGRRRLTASEEGDTVTVYGILEEEPVTLGRTVRMVLSADLTILRNVHDADQHRLLVSASAKKFGGLAFAWHAGTSVAVRGILDEFPRPRNPGEFDYGRYLALNNIDGILWITDTLPHALSHEPWRPKIMFSAHRAGFGRVFDRLHGSAQSGFLRGVLFGDRTDIAPDLKEAFINTGTIHILAVSGSNVAVIAVSLYMLLGLLRLPKRWTVAVTITGLLYYMMVTGASPSIVRATIMGCIILIGQTLERKVDVFNSISVAALIILLFNPLQLFDVGFQLSFAAVLSIVILYPRLEILIRKIPERFEEIRAVDAVLKLLAVSLAAQLGTLPFTAYYFGRISVVSLAANLVVVPVAGLNLVLGCLTLAASAVSDWIAMAYSALNEFLVSFLLGFVESAASVPLAVVETSGISMTGTAMFYLLLLGVFSAGNKTVRKYVAAGLLAVGTGSVWTSIADDDRETMRMTVLDVGQGDAIVIEFPNKSVMLIDAGPTSPGFDAGERIVVPFLRRKDISEIDRLVMSHAHSDHIGGVPFLLQGVKVGILMEADTAMRSRLHGTVRTAPLGAGVRQRIWTGMEISPDPSVRVYCLSPSPSATDGNLNNRSVVLKIQYGQTSIILPGDAEKEAEELVYRQYGSFLDSDILKAGHHGSATSSSMIFLDSITPNFAIISVGRRNKFKHPSRDVVKELHRRNIAVLRTDQEGAIILESDGHQWVRSHWVNEE